MVAPLAKPLVCSTDVSAAAGACIPARKKRPGVVPITRPLNDENLNPWLTTGGESGAVLWPRFWCRAVCSESLMLCKSGTTFLPQVAPGKYSWFSVRRFLPPRKAQAVSDLEQPFAQGMYRDPTATVRHHGLQECTASQELGLESFGRFQVAA